MKGHADLIWILTVILLFLAVMYMLKALGWA